MESPANAAYEELTLLEEGSGSMDCLLDQESVMQLSLRIIDEARGK